MKQELEKEMLRNRARSKTFKMKEKKEVAENFQDLSYLKAIPKKIDCWLAPDKLNTSRVSVKN